jgi:hypothetical protein
LGPFSFFFSIAERNHDRSIGDADSTTELLSGTTPVPWIGEADYQGAQTEKEAFLNQQIRDEILVEENALDEFALSEEDEPMEAGVEDKDALFEQLLHRAEQNLSSNPLSQRPQS